MTAFWCSITAMRCGLLIVSLGLLATAAASFALQPHYDHSPATAFADSASNSKPDFEKDIKPILQARCQPCHFQGGQVYEKLPFDKSETITRLGTKLFTRIKDEKERRVIQSFLDASK